MNLHYKYFKIIQGNEVNEFRALVEGQTLTEKEKQKILEYAFKYGATKILTLIPTYFNIWKYLLQHGSNYTGSLLQKAIENRHLHVVSQILTLKAKEPMLKSFKENGQLNTFQKILNVCVCKVCCLDEKKYSEPDITDEQRIEVLDILFMYGASPIKLNLTNCYVFAWSDIIIDLGKLSPILIKYLVDRGEFGLNTFSGEWLQKGLMRTTLIESAIIHGNFVLIKWLVANGADIYCYTMIHIFA